MRRWRIDPEVAGDIGPRTVMDTEFHPPRVTRLHYAFDTWLGDDIVQLFPCVIVSERLADALVSAGCSGVALDAVEVTLSDECAVMDPGLLDRLPPFRWLRAGESVENDVAIVGAELFVSDAALRVLKSFRLDHAEVFEVDV